MRQNYNHKKNNPQNNPHRPLGPRRSKKIFVEILPTNYIFVVHVGFSSRKTKLEKILTIEKMTPQGGTLGPSEGEKIFCRNFAN